MHFLWYPFECVASALIVSYVFVVGLTFVRELMPQPIKFVPDLSTVEA
jgi:hypothetical protein